MGTLTFRFQAIKNSFIAAQGLFLSNIFPSVSGLTNSDIRRQQK